MNLKPKPTDSQETAVSRSKNILETRKSTIWAGVNYQLQRRRKTGAYWYAFWHDATAGKTRSKYIGKDFRELTEADFI
jgi:hypothetical protein